MKFNFKDNPYIHILLFGFLLFIILLILLGPPGAAENISRIIVTDSDLEQVRDSWARVWQRQPTRQELQTGLKNYIREEVLYREALNRGYDENDQIIKRSLVRKMDFIAEGQVQAKDFTDDEIRAYYSLRKDKYRTPSRISFVHIYVNTDERGQKSEAFIKQVIERIERDKPDFIKLSEYGDRFMLQNQYADITEQEVRSLFGNEFATSLIAQEKEKWVGPVQSGYGLHAVYIYNRTESIVPDWTDIRIRIINDLLREERRAAKEQFYTEILRKYKVVHRGQAEELLNSGVQE